MTPAAPRAPGCGVGSPRWTALRRAPGNQVQPHAAPAAFRAAAARKSGLSLNHIIDCPLNCGYCVHQLGQLPWTTAHLVALDLEGSGAQDPDSEVILELAVVPIVAGLPHMPTLDGIQAHLAERIDGRYLVGHNVGVNWRLLHRNLPTIRPAGLIDTLRLARAITDGRRLGLSQLAADLGFTDRITAAAPGSQPHRALWVSTAAPSCSPTSSCAGVAIRRHSARCSRTPPSRWRPPTVAPHRRSPACSAASTPPETATCSARHPATQRSPGSEAGSRPRTGRRGWGGVPRYVEPVAQALGGFSVPSRRSEATRTLRPGTVPAAKSPRG